MHSLSTGSTSRDGYGIAFVLMRASSAGLAFCVLEKPDDRWHCVQYFLEKGG
jgi:hypothetical protein